MSSAIPFTTCCRTAPRALNLCPTNPCCPPVPLPLVGPCPRSYAAQQAIPNQSYSLTANADATALGADPLLLTLANRCVVMVAFTGTLYRVFETETKLSVRVQVAAATATAPTVDVFITDPAVAPIGTAGIGVYVPIALTETVVLPADSYEFRAYAGSVEFNGNVQIRGQLSITAVPLLV